MIEHGLLINEMCEGLVVEHVTNPPQGLVRLDGRGVPAFRTRAGEDQADVAVNLVMQRAQVRPDRRANDVSTPGKELASHNGACHICEHVTRRVSVPYPDASHAPAMGVTLIDPLLWRFYCVSLPPTTSW